MTPDSREGMVVLVADRAAGCWRAMSWQDYRRRYVLGTTRLKRHARRRDRPT